MTDPMTPREAHEAIDALTTCAAEKGCATVTEERKAELIAEGKWQDWYEVGELDPYRPSDGPGGCGHGDAAGALRQILTLLPDLSLLDMDAVAWGYRLNEPGGFFSEDEIRWAPRLIELVRIIAQAVWVEGNVWERETITELALEDSLCPMHFGDYASCFDDDEAECAAIRTIHPGHDT